VTISLEKIILRSEKEHLRYIHLRTLYVGFTRGTPREGFWESKPLPFRSKSNVTYGWHCYWVITW